MSINDLVRDSQLVPAKLGGDDRKITVDFVKRRARALIAADATLADPAKAGDLSAAKTPAVATQIKTELAAVKDAHAEIARRVALDPAHLTLSRPVLRTRVTTRPPTDDQRLMRRRQVLSIVYQAAAYDITLADSANIERLHNLCDRRLRIVERMLYEVGRADGRAWNATSASGPWTDGFERAFDYPRLPQSVFLGVCKPDAAGVCKAPMGDWSRKGSENLVGPIRTNPATASSWPVSASEPYELDYTRGTATGALDSIDAIGQLFTPSKDYLKRNLLYCDQTIHSLHLEALKFAEVKRRAGDHDWLNIPVRLNGSGWLRIFRPLPPPEPSAPTPEKFLAGRDEPSHFEQLKVRQADLQVGDHLIVYNHPAYEHTSQHGVWRLENAVVVQTVPELKMQGHGSYILGVGDAQHAMIKLFNTELNNRRRDLEPVAKVTADAGTNKVKVDSVGRLRIGLAIDIVHGATGAVLAPGPTITAISAATLTVTYDYDGPDVAATSAHVLRLKHTRELGQFDGIDTDGVNLLRRVAAAASQYDAASQLADWYVAWVATPEEEAIRKDTTRAAFVKDHQRVEYTVESSGGKTWTVGWFPLYEPVLRAGAPVKTAGKISKIQPVRASPDNIATWTWFFDADPAKRDMVPVLRPKVP
jgi:hypothetical protein